MDLFFPFEYSEKVTDLVQIVRGFDCYSFPKCFQPKKLSQQKEQKALFNRNKQTAEKGFAFIQNH